MKNILHIILISFVSFTIISCAEGSDSPTSATAAGVTSTGSDGTDGTNGKNSLISTTTESSGANCTTGGLKVQSGLDSDADGVLDSTEVTATSYICNGTVGTNGTNGDNGTNGTNGDNGTNGTNGDNGTNGTNGDNGTNGIQPAASLYCGAALEDTSLRFTYSAMIFSDNSVFVYGGVYGVAFEIGASKFYDSSQSGASTAAVVFTYDSDGTNNGGWWEISINRSTLAAVIVYHETNVIGGPSTTWTLNSSSNNCNLNSY